jgi:hypothetical protein
MDEQFLQWAKEHTNELFERGITSEIPISQEAAVMNDVIPRATYAARSIFVIPGGSILGGFDFLVTRLR